MKYKQNQWIRLNSEQETVEDQGMGMPIFIQSDQPQPPQQFGGIRVSENRIFFYSDINPDSCLELNRVLHELDNNLQNTKNMLGDEYTPIIHLHICSPGGTAFPAFSSVDTIRRIRSKVYTYIDGMAASAATLISTVGAKRFMGKHAHMLIHQLSTEMQGNYAQLEDGMYNCNNMMKQLKNFYKTYTKIPMKKLDEILKKDINLTAQECLDFGMVDEIL